MTRVTVKEAAERLPELLKELAAGGVVVVEMDGEEIALHSSHVHEAPHAASTNATEANPDAVPDYSNYFEGVDVTNAHCWGWEYRDGEFVPVELPYKKRQPAREGSTP